LTDRNNVNFKRLKLAFEFGEDEVVELCRLAGLEIAKDRVRRWARSPDAGSGKYTSMSDAEFDAFCEGVLLLMRSRG